MKEFKFYQDQKVTVWERTYFNVKAEIYEEALQKIESLKNNSVLDNEKFGNGNLHIELLSDTVQEMSVEDNQGWATIETYDEEGELLFANGKH